MRTKYCEITWHGEVCSWRMAYCIKSHRNRLQQGDKVRKSKEPLSPSDTGTSCERAKSPYHLPIGGRAAKEQIAAIPFQLENELQKRMSHDRLPTGGQDAASKASSSASQPAAVSNPNPTKQNSATAPNGSRRMFSPIRQCAYWMMITNPGAEYSSIAS